MKQPTTRQLSRATRSDVADVRSPHPFDEWLKRELGQLYVAEDKQPLPPEIAELARRLEQTLGGLERDETPAEPTGPAGDRHEKDREGGNV